MSICLMSLSRPELGLGLRSPELQPVISTKPAFSSQRAVAQKCAIRMNRHAAKLMYEDGECLNRCAVENVY